MFKELMPLVANRTLLITVARESDTTIRATVIPKRMCDGENPALTTPLTFTGAPEELDQEFPRALAEYVEAHQHLSTTLAQAKSEMEAAAKAAEEEAKRKREERLKKKTATSEPASSGSPQPTDTSNGESAKPTSANLFDGSPSRSQPGGKLCL
jgi:PRTRC genetic system protein E